MPSARTTEPFPGEDIGLELGLLCDALDLLTGGAFLFAVCEDGPLRRRLIQQVRDHLEAEGHRDLIEVDLSPEQPDLAGSLAPHFPTTPEPEAASPDLSPAVFVSVHGLADAGMDVANLAEDHPDRVRVEQSRRAWRSLNIRRERLSHLNAPLVFWLSQNALGQLMQHAADIFAARSQIFLFETRLPEPDALPPMRSEATMALLDRFHRTLLPPQELRKRASFYEQRLTRQRAAAEPNWAGIAFLCRDLAAIYRELDDYERAGSFQDEAIEAYLTAIARSDEGDQNRNQDWAPLQVWLGLAYQERLRGDRAGNLEQAIVHFQQALEVRTRQAFPTDWAMTQNNLGNAFANRLQGDRAGNLEQAIVHYQQALEVRTRQVFSEDWAGIQNNLGTAFADRIKGDRAGNLEQAIVHYQQALEVRTRQAFPADWALTQNNLGNAFANRLQGNRADNLEQAIVHYRQALEVRTRQAFPADWAMTQNNLGAAFADRIKGDRARNLKQAIAHYQQALEVRTRQAFPEQWAMTQNNLGIAFANRLQGDRAGNLEQAIVHYRQALEVHTRQAFPTDWAMTQNNLGNAYRNRLQGDRAGNLEQAIVHYQQALEVRTRQAFPAQWAKTRYNLGLALLDQGQLHQERQDFEAAERSLTDALQLFQDLNQADGVAAAQEALGRLALQSARPAEAQTLLKEARQQYAALEQPERVEAIDELLGQVERGE
ncbi:MAG TPA: hypothetical protein VGD99_00340 [Anaerolineae bacterium]